MTADTIGGVWTYALQLIQALGKWNVEVFLATMGRKLSAEQWSNANALSNLHILESDYKLEWMQDPWHDVESAGKWLKDLEHHLKPDLIHLNNYAHGSCDWNAPCLITAHSDVFSWFAYVKNSSPDRPWFNYHRAVECGLNSVDHVVGITRAVQKDLNAQYYFDTPSSVIHNGLFRSNFRPAEKEDFVLSVGRIWDEAKNFGLLNAAAKNFPFPISVAGENHHPEFGTKSNVHHLHFTGNLDREDLSKLMGRAAVYCLPATYEPFGYTPLEAAFSGCALVLADIETMKEVWKDAALYFNPEDPDDLRQKLKRVLEDHALRKTLANRAQVRARRYTAEKMAASYLKLYTKMVNHQFATKLMTAYAN